MDCPSTEAVISAACEEFLLLLGETADLMDALLRRVAGRTDGAGAFESVSSVERLVGDVRYYLAVITDLATDVVALGNESQRCQGWLALRAVNTHRGVLDAASGLVGALGPGLVVRAS